MKLGWSTYKWLSMGLMLLSFASLVREVSADTNEFKGTGPCQFALHGYKLSSDVEKVLNLGVAGITQRYRTLLGMDLQTLNPRLRIRIYDSRADFRTNMQADSPQLKGSGYYSAKSDEIVVWRGESQAAMAGLIFHEMGHWILRRSVRRVPVWLNEGLAEYVACSYMKETPWGVAAQRRRLKQCADALNSAEGPALEALLKLSYDDFHGSDETKLYSLSWSLVWFLDRTAVSNGDVLKRLVFTLRNGSRAERNSADLLNRAYPGGLKQLEMDWHSSIKASQLSLRQSRRTTVN
jgi:hypothetical protein